MEYTKKFTKGEWKAHEYIPLGLNDESPKWEVFIDNEVLITGLENGADANLIASAPDMYEALKAYSNWCIDKSISGKTLTQVQEMVYDALVKAEGK